MNHVITNIGLIRYILDSKYIVISIISITRFHKPWDYKYWILRCIWDSISLIISIIIYLHLLLPMWVPNFSITSRSPCYIFVFLYMTSLVGTIFVVPTTGVIYVKSYNCICYFLCGYQILAPQVNALVIAKLKIFLHCCVKGLNGRSLIIHPAPADSISIYRQLINFTWIRKKDVHRRFLI